MNFYGQFEVPVDRFIFERYFPDRGIQGTFVECGAFDGLTECSCKFFEETMGWNGFNLEPVPALFEKLKSNRPNATNLNVGLSSSSGTVAFHTVEHPHYGVDTTIGAIEHDPAFKAALLGDGCTFHEISVDVITWAEFLARSGVQTIDLMVLDVEGHEMAVLSGMKGSAVLPHVMCVEFGHVGFDRLREAMSDLGYEYDITSFANAFFVRRDKVTLFALRRAGSSAARSQPEAPSLVSEVPPNYARVRELEAHVHSLEKSFSWRVTAPLRAIRSFFS